MVGGSTPTPCSDDEVELVVGRLDVISPLQVILEPLLLIRDTKDEPH